jgi:hypothetical protein
MLSLYTIPLAAQVVAPLALLVWHGTRTGSRSAALLRTSVAGTYLLALVLAGLWLAIPPIAIIAYAAVVAAQLPAVVGRARLLPWWPQNFSGWLGLTLASVLTVGSSSVLIEAAAGHRLPAAEAVALEFPLRNGTYVVANGGSNDLVNAHVQTLTVERFKDYRGQSFGLDIVGLNRLGMRSTGLVPSDPSRYVIFGQPIYAPCPGQVLATEDGHADMSPPQPDRDHMPGNFVFIDCGGIHVLLAHMKRGTVNVAPGERVSAGGLLGQVGNSGNSHEPHLHIHAQTPAKSGAFLSGKPLPIRFGGRYLARNDRVVVR